MFSSSLKQSLSKQSAAAATRKENGEWIGCHSLPLPTPKTQEQNQKQNPKQIPESILIIWRKRGSVSATHSSIDFAGLLTIFFFSCFSLFLVQFGLTFFFPLVFPCSLFNLGLFLVQLNNYLCVHLGIEGT